MRHPPANPTSARRAGLRLAACRYLLHGPPVSVRIAEEEEPDIVEWVRLRTGALAHDLDLADLHPSLPKLSTFHVEVRDDQLQPLQGESGGMSGTIPSPTTIEQPDPGGVS